MITGTIILNLLLPILYVLEVVKEDTCDKMSFDSCVLKFNGIKVQNEYIAHLLCKVLYNSNTYSAKSSDVFKTKQIYYALLNDGKMNAKLSQPRPLNILPPPESSTSDTRWPLNMDVITEKIVHLNAPPLERELLYLPTGQELQPSVVGPAVGLVVYSYEPKIGKFFIKSRPYGFAPQKQPFHSNANLLQFESRFESGNLRKAIYTGQNDYELLLRSDLFTRKYTQWFYFRVSNTQVDKRYRFTIVNFYKATSLFSSGMRPLMYSEKAARRSKIGWHRVGEDIQYYRTKWRDETASEVNDDDQRFYSKSAKRDRNSKYSNDIYYSLTWTFEFPYSQDVVYFACCYPYTYSQLRDYLTNLERNPKVRRLCQQQVLCETLAGNKVPILTITEPAADRPNSTKFDNTRPEKEEEPDNRKRCVIITARVHPGETQSSWMVQGMLEFLTSEDPDARLLRSQFVFKVVPMLNPDGVIVGNYRCSLSGCDLNRKYTSNLKRFFPTIWHTKEMVLATMREHEILVYCDLHGHSRKQHMFIYGCKSVNPEMRFHDRVFPAMLGKNVPELFDFEKCKFVVQKHKEGTGRIVMWRTGIANSYTLEATFCGNAGNEEYENYHFNTWDYDNIGRQFCDTLLDFCDPDQSKCEYILTELKTSARLRKLSKRTDDQFDDTSYSDSSSSPEDSSNTGSDSSNCDELPAYYAHILKKVSLRPRFPRRKYLICSMHTV
ncbi:Cytosolic carboxypeptidase 2 [Paragonimus heterotremus]|uniref:Cytosolic carboxypeptidase 2 n=1 Tax=Paragonimus heterotremus TaxID=100268 RepID=A0A8J4SZ00_9TREM|nr:Cytosolic carboxypeptidase 2 [Paragonimus heterotremus]